LASSGRLRARCQQESKSEPLSGMEIEPVGVCEPA
jgi:hypothetical protein